VNKGEGEADMGIFSSGFEEAEQRRNAIIVENSDFE
jgi:hypothetical protein